MEVCVLVDVEENSSHVISIVFTSKQTRIAKTVSTGSDGKVCTLLPAGEYFVWVCFQLLCFFLRILPREAVKNFIL